MARGSGYLYVPPQAITQVQGNAPNAAGKREIVVPFERIASVPCLALLGEPGMGKSRMLRQEMDALQARLNEAGSPDEALWMDLRSYGAETRLLRDLFESDEFLRWKAENASHALHLFVDSLDECLLRLDHAAKMLADELRRRLHSRKAELPQRLFLRITCRTAIWPRGLEGALRELWGGASPNDSDGSFAVYELAPLQREDVLAAAALWGLDAAAFAAEVERKRVEPLAAKPVTLRFLLNLYADGRGTERELPRTEAELYLRGCRLLCTSTDADRPATSFSAEQKLVVAARLAAATIFSNREAIWRGEDDGLTRENTASLRELCGGTEFADQAGHIAIATRTKRPASGDGEFEVTPEIVEATLDTGLFSSRGGRAMGWAHQTYAEFLAAFYLAARQIPIRQVQRLLAHPSDPERLLVPQLYETAARLACLGTQTSRELFAFLRQQEPNVLLQSDVAAVEEGDRRALVESLLRPNESGVVPYHYLPYGQGSKLLYLGLEERLRACINDADVHENACHLAIEIASHCHLNGLGNDIASVALECSQSLWLRGFAAATVGRLGDRDTKRRLLPLARGETGDNRDDLKGSALGSMWPDALSARELFEMLTPPQRETVSSHYGRFLSSDLVPHLQPHDLPLALDWVERQGERRKLEGRLDWLVDDLVRAGWEHLDAKDVLPAFARVAWLRFEAREELTDSGGYYTILGQKHSADEFLCRDYRKRRLLLDALAPCMEGKTEDLEWRLPLCSPFALSDDVPWLLDHLQEAVSSERRRVWTRFITRVCDQEHLPLVVEACRNISELAKAYAWLLQPVVLGSPEAQKMKSEHEMWARLQRRERNQNDRRSRRGKPLQPPPDERVRRLLDEFEAGDVSAWWRLVCYDLTLGATDEWFFSDRQAQPDITRLPGWQNADEATRQRLIEAAVRYLRQVKSQPRKWLGKKQKWLPDAAGHKALRLLELRARERLLALTPDEWARWAPVVVFQAGASCDTKDEPTQLLKTGYRRAPQHYLRWITRRIERANVYHEHLNFLDELRDCWDESLGRALLSKAKDAALVPSVMGRLLELMLEYDTPGTRIYAQALVEAPRPSSPALSALPLAKHAQSETGDEAEENTQPPDEALDRAQRAALALLTQTSDAGWPILWPLFGRDVEVARDVVESVARSERRRETFHEKLSPRQVGDFYLWLAAQYPHSEDPRHDGWHTIGTRENVAGFRDSLVSHLTRRGTFEAYAEVRRLRDALPSVEQLKSDAEDAGETARRRTWQPPEPGTVLAMCRDARLHQVETGDALLEAVVESLQRLAQRLHNETPAVHALWNAWPAPRAPGKRGRSAKLYRPKDEEDLSNFIRAHLQDDLAARGIITNREVEIRPGERTDVHVDAIARDHRGRVRDQLSLIIEVKGCWNRDLAHAAQTQLTDRYLRDNSCRHGLYVVGWFHCPRWDASDPDRDKALRFAADVTQAQTKLDAQAAALSQGDLKVRAFVLNTTLQ